MISVKGISKIYKSGKMEYQALNDVTIDIKRGEFVAIMGPSGSGKSTLMHLLGFLDKPDSGSYLLEGKETADLSDEEYARLRQDKIGFVFQQFHLLPRSSAEENVAMPLVYSGKKTFEPRAKELLDSVGLGTKLKNLPGEMSGGEKQRAAIARALINDPEILFADEPTGNLDSKSEKEIMEIFTALNNQGKTIVMVTHEPEIAEYAHRIITVRDGKILSDKKTLNGEAKLSDAPQHREKQRSAGLEIEFKDYLKQALISVMGNKLRSALSVLGILIGVASVIAMLALAEGAKESINKQLSSLGSNLLVVSPAYNRSGGVSREGATRITLQDSQEAARLASVKNASGLVSGNVQAVYGNKNKATRVEGASHSYEEIRSYKPAAGRFFTNAEEKQRERVALLGATVVKELFGSEDPTGATVKINRVNFKVIGVLPLKGSGGWRDQDDTIIIPINTAMYRLLGKQYVDQIYVQAKDADSLESAQDEIMELLNKRHNISASRKDPAFEIRNMAEMQEAIQSTSRTLTWLLGSIAAISLLVGGIGIMNIMLVSVKERTREIGLRKAVGARSFDILYQFMIEAVLMTLTGGLAGIILGALIAFLMAVLAGWAVKVSVFSVLLSVFFSAATGLGFGIWPARQAAELNPIDALRYE